MPYTPPGGRWVVYLTSPCSSSPETEAYSIPWRALRCDAVTEEGGSSMPCPPLGGSWVKPVVEPREDLSGMRNWVQPRPLPWGLAWLSWGQMLNTLTDTSPGWLERQTGGRWLHLQGMWSLVSRLVRSWMELTQLFNFHMKHRMEGRRKGWR